MAHDADLQSIQEMRDLVRAAKEAQLEFRNYDQTRVDRIVKAMADAGYEAAERLGRLAHEETGFGNPAHKKLKNEFATRRVWESIRDLRTVGVIREDREKRIIEIAEPMGVVCALIPSTNPTSTAMFKAIISVKGRNGIVASPHPRSARSTSEALQVVSQAAEAAGAPHGLIGCLPHPTLEATGELMKHKLVSVILATGSTPMVKTAYSAGKPCYGVGAGNVPAYIEKSADIRKAVADIVSGKTFDNGVLCSTEASVVVDRSIRENAVDEFRNASCWFTEGEDLARLSRLMFDSRGTINAGMVGKPAPYIAQQAGIQVPENTRVLVAELNGVGRDYPLSREKLSPVLSFFTVTDWREGCERCIELLEFGGMGHTLVIHSTDEDIIMKFALEKPANRILVNTQAALGAVGYTNELLPSLTLGPGTFGGSIISDNVSAKHLINIKRLAFETRPINKPGGSQPHHAAPVPAPAEQSRPKSETPVTAPSWIEQIEERIRLKAGNPAVGGKAPAAEKEAGTRTTFGNGMSEADVEKVIREFSRR
ncbi:MAG TPA: aldehyde dehydrogenase family protein [Bacteroidota bacterium]|nr:aldehyde dehydrogenase family protein [Bacteroidota bacterium]